MPDDATIDLRGENASYDSSIRDEDDLRQRGRFAENRHQSNFELPNARHCIPEHVSMRSIFFIA
jgi:hypothetical protein